tara:strand:+ start:894 stop:1607 length:714 start_codon:yes stop_codon:yes gene_type:complete
MKQIQITKKILEEFLPISSWRNFEVLPEIVIEFIKYHNITPIEHNWYQSGGGCCHYFLRDSDKHIWSFHCADEIIEYSYNKWDSIDDYLETDDEQLEDKLYGFGWECESPNYNERHKHNQWKFDFYVRPQLEDNQCHIHEQNDDDCILCNTDEFKVGDLVKIKKEHGVVGSNNTLFFESVWTIKRIDKDSVDLHEKRRGGVKEECFFLNERPYYVENEVVINNKLEGFPISLIEHCI